ncbi:MAG: aminoacyl-tRNA hydrolase [Gammaproteobacteria bacterium]
MAIKLIVGLGNPGKDYTQTRHNAGAWFVEHLAAQCSATWRTESKFQGQVATFSLNQHSIWLLFPTTFMNASGQAVRAFSQFYQIPPDAILIAHDELDFSPGTVRLKEQGGHGGHNGLRSITQHLQTDHYNRLRIGIGHPGHRDRVHDYVLSRPSQADYSRILDSFIKVDNVLPEFLLGDRQKAIQLLHSAENES